MSIRALWAAPILGCLTLPVGAVESFEETFSGTGGFTSRVQLDGGGAPIPGVLQTAGFEHDGWVHFADTEPVAAFDVAEGTLDVHVTNSRDPLAREILSREIGTGDFLEEIRFKNLRMGQVNLAAINLVHQGDGFDAFSLQLSDFGSPNQLTLFLSLNHVPLPDVRVLDFVPGGDLAIRVGWTENTEDPSGQYVVETSINGGPFEEQFNAPFAGTSTTSRSAMLQFGLFGFAEDLFADLDYWQVEALRTLTADFDVDGDVDGEDFLAWQNGFGILAGASLADGDADGDGDVDGDDFLNWQAEFGAGGGGASTAIPEPGSGAMLGLLAAAAAVTFRLFAAGQHHRST